MNQHQLHTQDPIKAAADCLIVGVYQDSKLKGLAKTIDTQTGGLISRLIKAEDFVGKEGSTHLLHELAGLTPSRLMLVGLGKDDKDTSLVKRAKHYKKSMAAVGKALKSAKFTLIINALPEAAPVQAWATLHGIIELERAMNVYPASMKEMPKAKAPKTFHWYAGEKAKAAEIEAAIVRGAAVAFGMEKLLLVANHPANVCTPSGFANFAESFVAEVAQAQQDKALSIKVLKPEELKKLGMNSFLGVAKGSVEPARLVEIRYQGSQYAKGKRSKGAPVVLVGKGVTFDSGGISLKPGAEMDHMKWDMCGAASVLGALLAAAKMKLPIDVVGITPLCENMPSGHASKPSDVVTAMNGLTIENLNTDAEGRLILCDALTYAQREHKPSVLIDVATLTGACVVALGDIRMALYSNQDALGDALKAASDEALDFAWPMPYDEDYLEGMKSNFADLANISGRSGGSVTAAMFLSKFIEKDTTWAHLDIAGVAYVGTGPNKGATGRPLPMLMQYLMNVADGKIA